MFSLFKLLSNQGDNDNDTQYLNKMKRVIKKKMNVDHIGGTRKKCFKKNFVKLPDDYINMSKFLYDLTIDCSNDISKLNETLESLSDKITHFIEFISDKDKDGENIKEQ